MILMGMVIKKIMIVLVVIGVIVVKIVLIIAGKKNYSYKNKIGHIGTLI